MLKPDYIEGQIRSIQDMIDDLKIKKRRLEALLAETKPKVQKGSPREEVVKYLQKEGITITEHNLYAWKDKDIEFRTTCRTREMYHFNCAVAVWLTPLLSSAAIGNILHKERSNVTYMYRTFLAEAEKYPYPHKYSEIQQWVKKFQD